MKTFDPKIAIPDILKIIDPIVAKYSNLDPRDYSETHANIHVVERLKWNLDSLYILLINDVIKHHHAIGLIIRNILTDCYTMTYIKHYNSDGISEERKRFGMYKEDLDRYDQLLNLLYENGIFTEDDHNAFLRMQADEEFPIKRLKEFIEANNIKPINSTNTIVRKLLTNRKEQKHKNINNLYDMLNRSYFAWNIYSKHEHIGFYSYLFSRNRDAKVIQRRFLSDLHQILIASLWLISYNLDELGESKAKQAVIDYSTKVLIFGITPS